MNSYLALLMGAIIGSSLRYLVYLNQFNFLGIPLSTTFVNIFGSSLAGFFFNKLEGQFYIFLYVGLFGSFTTLSAFNVEIFNLLSNQSLIKALIYFVLNIFTSFIFFYIFYLLGLKIAY